MNLIDWFLSKFYGPDVDEAPVRRYMVRDHKDPRRLVFWFSECGGRRFYNDEQQPRGASSEVILPSHYTVADTRGRPRREET